MKNIRKKKYERKQDRFLGRIFITTFINTVSVLYISKKKKKTISNISHSVSLKQDVMNIIKCFAPNLMFVQYSQLSSCHWKLFVPSTD